MLTYPELLEEHLEIDGVAAVFWETLEELRSFVFAYLDAEVHEAPPEVINVQILVSLLINGFEYFS